jgi:glycosyltransferase involved in cell wall biosynthesis
MSSHQKKILIIIPAFNEEGNIAKTIQEIRSLKDPFTILVVNDGSKDHTAQLAQEAGANVISLPYNLGIGGAVQTGFKYAREHQFDIAVQVDGDGQHDVTFLKNILEPLFRNEADMTIGSRFLPPYLGYRSSFVRRVGINFFAHLISLLTLYKVTDPTSGFRAYNRSMINVFAAYYPSDFPEPEAIVVAGRYQARVKEVPVQMRKRISGNSSIRYLKTLYYMVKVTLAILLDKLKQRKNI